MQFILVLSDSLTLSGAYIIYLNTIFVKVERIRNCTIPRLINALTILILFL